MRKISFLLVLAMFCACQSSPPKNAYEREYEKIANVKALPRSYEKYIPEVTPSPMKRNKPFIGMDIVQMEYLCGKPNKSRTYQSAKTYIDTYEYKYRKETADRFCFGTFTFINDKLDSISR